MGGQLKRLRLRHLQKDKNSIGICKNCDILNYYYNKWDDIDNYADELLKKYE